MLKHQAVKAVVTIAPVIRGYSILNYITHFLLAAQFHKVELIQSSSDPTWGSIYEIVPMRL